MAKKVSKEVPVLRRYARVKGYTTLQSLCRKLHTTQYVLNARLRDPKLMNAYEREKLEQALGLSSSTMDAICRGEITLVTEIPEWIAAYGTDEQLGRLLRENAPA